MPEATPSHFENVDKLLAHYDAAFRKQATDPDSTTAESVYHTLNALHLLREERNNVRR